MKKHKPFTITLSEKERVRFIKIRAVLAKAIATGNTRNSAQSAMEREITAIPGQIAKLEKRRDLTDENTLAIAAKKEKLRLLTERLANSEKPTGQAETDLNRLLLEFRAPYHQAMRQVQEQLTWRILVALEPFYQPARLSANLANDTDAMRQFGSFISIGWGLGQNPILAARKAIQFIDLFLAGKSPFQLD
jgi:hypothetical protein